MALIALAIKCLLALTTYGTEDVHTWLGFAHGVAAHGPVRVYGVDFLASSGTTYNHPPLVGYLLVALNQLADWGVPLGVSLRCLSSVADVVTALLVLEILRRRRTLDRAVLAACAVAVSPVLILISGYHGNTDPLFVMLLVLGTFLVIDRDRALAGGGVLALALGIKLVAVVALPVMAAHLLRHRRDLLRPALTGFAATILVTWLPAVLLEADSLRRNVLGYSGITDRHWGLVRFLDAAGWAHAARLLAGPGRFVVLAICALAPAAIAWRDRGRAIEAVALSLTGFLALSPAFGVQYLAWAVAASYLLDAWWPATSFNLLASLLLFEAYDRWNDGFPWDDVAFARPFITVEVLLAGVVWAVLVVVVAQGSRKALQTRPRDEVGVGNAS